MKICIPSTALPCQKCTSLYTFGSEFRHCRNIVPDKIGGIRAAFDKCSTYQNGQGCPWLCAEATFLLSKNSPSTNAHGRAFVDKASSPSICKKDYYKKTNKKNILKNTYCKKHSIQLFYKQLSPITHTDRKKRYSVPHVFYIGMSFRIGTIQSKNKEPLQKRTGSPPGIAQECTGCTFLGGVLRGKAPKRFF